MADEISFVLQNIFIIKPTPHAKYKIRVIVSKTKGHSLFKKVGNRYTFELPSDQTAPDSCHLSLLEKTQGQYLQIGRGQVDLAQLLLEGPSSQTTLNGVIYGTRSFNFDRIIGKFSYLVYKSQALSHQKSPPRIGKSSSPVKKKMMEEQQQKRSPDQKSRILFVQHKRKEKPPEFAFKKAILNHSQDINSKIKELTRSMNKLLQNKGDYESLEKDKTRILPILEEADFQDGDCYFRYSGKVEQLLKDNQHQQFKILTVRNIRIERPPNEEQPDRLTRLSIGSKVTSKEKKCVQILLVFFQLLEDRKLRKRVLQVFLSIHFGCDNRFLANSIFYLPNSPRKLLIQVIFLSSPILDKDNNLNGVLEPSRAKSRLVELLDSCSQQRGILICQLEECKLLDQEQIRSYQKQTGKFDGALRKFGAQFSSFTKKLLVEESKEEEKIQSKPLDNLGKDTLYSQFHPKSKASHQKRNRLKTEVSKTTEIQLLTPSISRYRSNKSVISRRSNADRSVSSSFDFESKSIRGQPKQSETMLRLRSKYEGTNWEGPIRVYIENVNTTIYGIDLKNKKIIITFDLGGQSQSKKLFLKGENDRQPLHLQFKDKNKEDVLTVTLLLNRPNSTRFYKIGEGRRLINQLGGSNRVKIFLTAQSKINGFVVINYKLFREKEDEEKSQSFYYQEGFDRDISLISQQQGKSRPRFMLNTFENFEEVDIPIRNISIVREREQDDQEFELSVGSREMLQDRTQLQQISEKMSEKAPSEVVEEEDYVEGKTIKRRI